MQASSSEGPACPSVRARVVARLALLLVLATACASTPPAETRPPRGVELEGTINTRDLGGYPTEDGRTLRWGQLYRSDELHELDDDDVEILAQRRLQTVIDFRTEVERKGKLDVLPPDTDEVWLPISFPSMDPNLVASRILRGDAPDGYFRDMLQRANRSFALDHGPELAAFLEKLAEPGALPALFHCTYGKDRTGFVAAMLLELLGVPWETVQEDYLLSNLFLSGNIDRMARLIRLASLFRISGDDARDLLGVQAEYLDSAREATLEEYGSIEAYVKAFGVTDETLQRLRDLLVE